MALNVWDRMKYSEPQDKQKRIDILAAGTRKQREASQEKIEPHNEWTPYAGPLLWTGPDGTRDYRPRLYNDWHLLGIGENTPEKTLSATYISRAPANQPFGKRRTEMIGEIGWFYRNYGHTVERVYPENMER